VSFTLISLCVASQRVTIVSVCFVIDSFRTLLDTLSYIIAITNTARVRKSEILSDEFNVVGKCTSAHKLVGLLYNY
jgi:hypothetical protein